MDREKKGPTNEDLQVKALEVFKHEAQQTIKLGADNMLLRGFLLVILSDAFSIPLEPAVEKFLFAGFKMRVDPKAFADLENVDGLRIKTEELITFSKHVLTETKELYG